MQYLVHATYFKIAPIKGTALTQRRFSRLLINVDDKETCLLF